MEGVISTIAPTHAQPLILHAEGPFGFLTDGQVPYVLEATAARQRGIYFFAVAHGSQELVHYVGETGREFCTRMREHLPLYLNGTFDIYDSDRFAAGHLHRLWEGMLRWDSIRRANEFLNRHAELFPHIEKQIRAIRLWLLPTDVERRTRRLVEGSIARALMTQPAPVGTFHEQIHYEYRDDDEPSVPFTIANHERFVGMQARLTT